MTYTGTLVRDLQSLVDICLRRNAGVCPHSSVHAVSVTDNPSTITYAKIGIKTPINFHFPTKLLLIFAYLIRERFCDTAWTSDADALGGMLLSIAGPFGCIHARTRASWNKLRLTDAVSGVRFLLNAQSLAAAKKCSTPQISYSLFAYLSEGECEPHGPVRFPVSEDAVETHWSSRAALSCR